MALDNLPQIVGRGALRQIAPFSPFFLAQIDYNGLRHKASFLVGFFQKQPIARRRHFCCNVLHYKNLRNP